MGNHRRVLLKAGLGWGIGLQLQAQESAAAQSPKEGDMLVKVDAAGATPLAPADIPVAAGLSMALAMHPADKTVRGGSRLNRILLARFAPDQLSEETRARAADGVVAYTAICTHFGCEVTEWVADEQRLFCPCH